MGLFDFNRDGHTSFGEELFGLGMIGAVLAAAQEEDELSRVSAEQDALNTDIEEQIDELYDRRSGLEDKLSDLQDREPCNPDSEAHDRWEERCDAIEDQISDLEGEISDLEDALDM
jgi:chromosome segregation ATPase